MSGRRNCQAAVRFNPSVDERSDTVMKEEDDAPWPPTTRSKRGSPKPTDRYDPAWEGRSDTETKRARGETCVRAPPNQTEAQEALDREAQEELGRSIEAMFQAKYTGPFDVNGHPYRLAKDP